MTTSHRASPVSSSGHHTLTELPPGFALLYAGNKLARVPDEIAAAFQPGDHLVVVQTDGTVLHIPAAQYALVAGAVGRARDAFGALRDVSDAQIDTFYEIFAARLADDAVWTPIAAANEADVAAAQQRGRSTTRLIADARMRRRMIEALAQWRATPSGRGAVLSTIEHSGWRLEQVADGLGVVAFVFEGRPNVFADATGVLRGGNTAVMRIGSDALGTARAIAAHALVPSLAQAGLPDGAVQLLDSAERSAGWALFSHRDVALAVARGSGPAAAQLGAVARQAGIPVSLHGEGGAWIIADVTADAARLREAVYHSTDRKVCNTLNTLCLPRSRAAELAPIAIEALDARGRALGHAYKLHVTDSAHPFVPPALFATAATMLRAEGEVEEPLASSIADDRIGHEWEWEGTPEVTLTVVEDTDTAIALFNEHSPLFVASLISEDPAAHERFFRTVDAPCVGDGFTRWLDGQFALERPELGLTNWQEGRLLARHSILTGDGVHTIRLRVHQTDMSVHQ